MVIAVQVMLSSRIGRISHRPARHTSPRPGLLRELDDGGPFEGPIALEDSGVYAARKNVPSNGARVADQ